MKFHISITDNKIDHAPFTGKSPFGAAGALVEFTGIVRGSEDSSPIKALRYEAYHPMAENQVRHILQELDMVHPCLAATVIHRIGVVPVGSAAIYVGAWSVHRAEAFALVAKFMDRLKVDVPIWKTEVIS